jgi:3-phosphoshikimate 1-carboxyvinyltransferase
MFFCSSIKLLSNLLKQITIIFVKKLYLFSVNFKEKNENYYIKSHKTTLSNIQYINLPASKSISNRLLVLEFIYGKNLNIQNLSNSNDTLIFKSLLKHIKNKEIGKIDCEDCGTAYRFLTAVCTVTDGFWRITGTETLKKRPMKWLIDVLNKMSVQARSTKAITFADNGDLLVSGGKLAAIDISDFLTMESSQFLSALAIIQPKLLPKRLICDDGVIYKSSFSSLRYVRNDESVRHFRLFDFFNEGDSKTPFNDNFPSKPYFEMTLKLMRQIESNTNDFTVEADWSSCSYFLAAMLLNDKIDELFFPDLKFSNLQGDQICADIFAKFGLIFCEINGGILVRKSNSVVHPHLSILQQDFTDCPDLYPTFKILSRILKIDANFTGTENLIYKESNRIANIDNELDNFDKKTDNYVLNTYNDHRLAMAFALLKVKNHNVKIENPECVKKSFPNFWSEFEKMLTLS